jgi:signal peptidase I
MNSTSSAAARRRWREYRGFALFFVLMLGFRSSWADWVHVPTGSMNPTILEGDRILVDKHVFGVRVPLSLWHLTAGEDPRRGDIVVFDSPRDGTSLVKRVAGIPGDVLQMDGERLIVNGMPASYAPGNAAVLTSLLAETRTHEPAVMREAGIMPDHQILLLPDRLHGERWGPLRVPDGQYFMLGDNRDNSADSRYIGFVPRRNIVGLATRVAASFDPDHHYRPRFDRVLQPL